jgi:hypothetical protein
MLFPCRFWYDKNLRHTSVQKAYIIQLFHKARKEILKSSSLFTTSVSAQNGKASHLQGIRLGNIWCGDRAHADSRRAFSIRHELLYSCRAASSALNGALFAVIFHTWQNLYLHCERGWDGFTELRAAPERRANASLTKLITPAHSWQSCVLFFEKLFQTMVNARVRPLVVQFRQNNFCIQA